MCAIYLHTKKYSQLFLHPKMSKLKQSLLVVRSKARTNLSPLFYSQKQSGFISAEFQ